jgi:hypothetical protein
MIVPIAAGKWEDHLTGGPWLPAHARDRACDLEDQHLRRQDRRGPSRTSAGTARRNQALQRVEWLDDGDGVAQASETDTQASGVPAMHHCNDPMVLDLREVTTPDLYYRSRVTEDR